MGPIDQVWGLLKLAVKRLTSDLGLTLGVLLGLVTTVALVTSVPMYVEAANNKILRQELGEIEARGAPAFAFMYHIAYPGHVVLAEEFGLADEILSVQVPALFRLPLDVSTVSVQSVRLGLFPATAEHYGSTRRPLTQAKIGFVRGLRDHAEIIDGEWPEDSSLDGPLPALITQGAAAELGVQAGEEYVLFRESERLGRIQVPVRIAGVWVPRDAEARFWFIAPDAYDEVVLVPEATYVDLASSEELWALDYVAWCQVYDGSRLTAEDVPGFLASMRHVAATLKRIIPSLGVPVSPEWALVRYEHDVRMQGRILLTFGIPIVVIVLVFTVFVAAIAVRRRSSEVALLRSRGTSVLQVSVLCLFQGLILGVLALFVGVLAGMFVARLLGSTRAFLSFDTRALVPTDLLGRTFIGQVVHSSSGAGTLYPVVTPTSLWAGIVVTFLAVALYLLLTLGSVRETVISYWRTAVRTVGQPWWQRSFFDVLLALVAAYGYYLFKQGRGFALLMGGQGNSLGQPLTLVTPSLYLFVGALVFLRMTPYLLSLAAWIAQFLPGPVLVLACRHLARRVRGYSGVYLLLAYSISLSLFTASLAWTLDTNLAHRAYYQVGADLSFQERGWGSQPLAEGAAEDLGGGIAVESPDDAPTGVLVVPTEEALQIEGVEGATRIHRFTVRIRLPNWAGSGTLIGVDRLSFPGVAFFRRDFASRSLGELMNALALDRTGVLVDRETLARNQLAAGDTIRVQLSTTDATRIDFRIVGIVDLFPGVQREDFPLFVGSADYVLEQMGALAPGKLWLAVDPSTDAQVLVDRMHDTGFRISSLHDARLLIAKEQGQLLRVGLFGFLSVGFAAVSLLIPLSLVTYSFASFQQRAIQFGLLQAIGLTKVQLQWLYTLEQLVVIVMGAVAGTALGWHGCRLFLPYFQVSYSSTLPLPPPLTVIAWRDISKIYGALGLSFLVLSLVTLGMLGRLRAFEAIKLGTQLTD
jgi:putative ABC transport system permease protein